MNSLLLASLACFIIFGNILNACYFMSLAIVCGLIDIDHTSIGLLFLLLTYYNLGIFGVVYVILSLILCVLCIGMYLFGPCNINLHKNVIDSTGLNSLLTKCSMLCSMFNKLKNIYTMLCKLLDEIINTIIHFVKLFRVTTEDIILMNYVYALYDMIYVNITKIQSFGHQLQNLCKLAKSFISNGNLFSGQSDTNKSNKASSKQSTAPHYGKKNGTAKNGRDDVSLDYLDNILNATLKEFNVPNCTTNQHAKLK